MDKGRARSSDPKRGKNFSPFWNTVLYRLAEAFSTVSHHWKFVHTPSMMSASHLEHLQAFDIDAIIRIPWCGMPLPLRNWHLTKQASKQRTSTYIHLKFRGLVAIFSVDPDGPHCTSQSIWAGSYWWLQYSLQGHRKCKLAKSTQVALLLKKGRSLGVPINTMAGLSCVFL